MSFSLSLSSWDPGVPGSSSNYIWWPGVDRNHAMWDFYYANQHHKSLVLGTCGLNLRALLSISAFPMGIWSRGEREQTFKFPFVGLFWWRWWWWYGGIVTRDFLSPLFSAYHHAAAVVDAVCHLMSFLCSVLSWCVHLLGFKRKINNWIASDRHTSGTLLNGLVEIMSLPLKSGSYPPLPGSGLLTPEHLSAA